MANPDGVRTEPKNPFNPGLALLAISMAASFFYIFASDSLIESIYHLCVRLGLEDIVLLAPQHQSMRTYLIEKNNFTHWQSVTSYLSTCFIAMVCCLSVSFYRMYDYIPYLWANNKKWLAKTRKEQIKASCYYTMGTFALLLFIYVYPFFLADRDWDRPIYKMPSIQDGSPMFVYYSLSLPGGFVMIVLAVIILTSLFFIRKKEV